MVQRHWVRGSCYLSWVGVCCKMCFSYSLSHQPWWTGLLSAQPLTGARDSRPSALSSFHLFVLHSHFSIFLLPCIGFITFPSFPHARTVFIHPPLSFFSCSFLNFSSFLGSSPGLARLSIFSLPHFLCALQWFFRFFPTYRLPLSIQPCVSFPCTISLPYGHTWRMKGFQ